jgi:riboflavin synthase
MFTGLVRELGRLAATSTSRGISRLDIDAARLASALEAGASLAVNGICLTVTRIAGTRVSVEATAETRRVTTLPRWRTGDLLHLEPALRAGDALGGHFVLGHVDGTGRIVQMNRRGGARAMTVTLPANLARRLLPKGSIAVDGVSLTLDEGPFPDRFTVTLIPHTLASTRFGRAKAGDHVNLELDVLSKAAAAPLTLDSFRARGWDRGRT